MRIRRTWVNNALSISALLLSSSTAYAASCCGGGNATSLVLPKFGNQMIDVSFDMEDYKGYWNQEGDYTKDPAGSDLNQYRLNLGYAHRVADNWQASVTLPYVWNDNTYPGVVSKENGVGDMSASFWYETFDQVTCVYQVNSLADLRPAIYIGGTLTLPTGKSAYGDDATSSFDITGRGLYRFDANLLIEKTVYPFTVTLQGSYGKYLERDVNQEYGTAVAPYKKNLGDRTFVSASLGYTYFLEELDTLTFTAALADLREGEGEIDGVSDPLTEFEKQSVALTTAYASSDLRWVFKGTFSHALRQDGRGENFPTTDILTLGVSYAFY
ncbi:hypothetical protein [Alkalimarinus alittae]|uniref:Transporter n=1 Tax=Alkalimarinus alittae TaxID=2961619 RepID=A0ABY6N2J9_9ALTE|nr:hypothetical protein [Alkalimarinus alittae]UZE96342.1 hypothetical protein NKI27_00940 [Alkalimarinus alittae]